MRVLITDDRGPVARAAAARLAGEGHSVALNALGGEPVPGCERVRVDLKDDGALSALFTGWGSELGGVIHPAPEPILASVEDCDDALWDAAFREGALASMAVTRAAGEAMARNGRGALLYLGSFHAEKPVGNGFLYSMACASTQMLCREAALDYGSRGVTCVYVRVGPLKGDGRLDNAHSNQYKGVALRYPERAIPEPERFGALISFLLSEGAAPLNGSDVNAEGGYTLFYGIRREAHANG